MIILTPIAILIILIVPEVIVLRRKSKYIINLSFLVKKTKKRSSNDV